MDSYYLEQATYLLHELLDTVTDPPASTCGAEQRRSSFRLAGGTQPAEQLLVRDLLRTRRQAWVPVGRS